MPSKLSSIPLERVSSDALARAACFDELKLIENKPIANYLLDTANKISLEDSNPYRLSAYRRAAILLARADFIVVSEQTDNFVLADIGLSPNGTIIDIVLEYILDTTQTAQAISDVKHNKFVVFPTQWRNKPIDKDLLHIANTVINQYLNNVLSRFHAINKCLSLSKEDIASKQNCPYYTAIAYYSELSEPILNVYRDTILREFIAPV
jgi:hypothetical protein